MLLCERTGNFDDIPLAPPLPNAPGRFPAGADGFLQSGKLVFECASSPHRRAFHAAKRSSSVSSDTSETYFLTPTLRLVALRNRSPREALQIIIGKLLRCVGERAAHA